MKYRKKAIIVEALQWTGNNKQEIVEFCRGRANLQGRQNDYLYISTLEGIMFAETGSYVIKGVKGEYYPCREDIFLETYEKVDE